MHKAFNGHRNWNAWNVNLWLTSKESYYTDMKYCIKVTKNRKEAAQKLLNYLPKKTPDGAPFTLTNIIFAMRGL